MDLFEARTKTFILRFWLEPREIRNAELKWRGMIEYIPSGERHYFHRIEDLPKLIQPYLKETGTNLSPQKSIWQRFIPRHRNGTQDNSQNMANGSQRSTERSNINSRLTRLQKWWQRQKSKY